MPTSLSFTPAVAGLEARLHDQARAIYSINGSFGDQKMFFCSDSSHERESRTHGDFGHIARPYRTATSASHGDICGRYEDRSRCGNCAKREAATICGGE